MAIRPFEKECFVVGWFDEEGRLMNMQQYNSIRQAKEIAHKMKDKYLAFVGKLMLYTEPPQFQPGEKVQHKTYKSYNVGVVQGISKSGKKVKVHWPKWHFSSYYDPASLEKVDD